jgi:hypothetical protein
MSVDALIIAVIISLLFARRWRRWQQYFVIIIMMGDGAELRLCNL